MTVDTIGPVVTIEALSRDPHPHLARMRAEGPVSWVPELECWLVTSYALCASVMRDPELFTVDDPRFSTQMVIGPSMLSLDGQAHRLHRDPFSAPFRLRSIDAGISGWLDHRSRNLVDMVAPEGAADLREMVAGPLAVEAMARLLGLSGVSNAELFGWYEAIVDAVHGVTMGEPVSAEGTLAFDELRSAVSASFGRSHLLDSVVGAGSLSLDEIAANVAVLLFGGVVTGDGTNSMAIQSLLVVPGLVETIRADRTLVGAFVEEVLRMDPAAAAVDRYTTRPVELGGVTIPRGDLVRVSLTAANRDPAVFTDPDVLDLHRPNAGQHLTFARGPHACLGLHLARKEAQAVVGAVLDGLDHVVLDDTRWAPAHGLVFRGPDSVFARWSQSKTPTVD